MRLVRLMVLASLALTFANPLAPRDVTGHPHVWAEYTVTVRSLALLPSRSTAMTHTRRL
jgi:hypothetical protein